MKYLISIYLWLVGTIYFILFLYFALIVSLLFPAHRYDPWIKGSLRFLFKILWIQVKVEGIGNIHTDKTYVFMANHVSLFDIPLLGGFVPGFIRGVEATRQHQWLFYGWVMRRLGNIPIDRENIHQSIKTVRHTISIIQDGVSMIILPEGHRTLDGKLRSFKKLTFYLAKQVNCEIVPIGLSGLYSLKRKGSWIITPTSIKIKFGDPISIEEIQSLPVIELRDKVKSKIQDLIERP